MKGILIYVTLTSKPGFHLEYSMESIPQFWTKEQNETDNIAQV
jgi:hypothetical protein